MRPVGSCPVWLFGLALVLSCGSAWAHTTSTGLATITLAGSDVSYRLALQTGELPESVARLLTEAADGQSGSVQRVAEALRTKVRIALGEADCRPGRASVQGSRLGDGRIVLELTLRCPAPGARLRIRDDWADLFGEHHRTLARVQGAGPVHEVAFSPEAREVAMELRASPAGPHASFVWLGIEHILTGYDHLLFLVALLLRGGGLWSLARIVTAFTLAHSLTLALAVLGGVNLPARVVEPVIAASIVWVALENVRAQGAPARRWLASLGFGLVHGFGFAGALADLALPPRSLAMALLGFNVGVEVGQAFVVVAMLPLLLWLRRQRWEARATRILSLLLAGAGGVWLVERLLLA